MTDLCTIENVKFHGGISGTLHDARITQMIEYMSEMIREGVHDLTLDSTNFNAKMACVYGTLAWLEGEGRIKGVNTSKFISKQSDGQVSFEFKQTSQRSKSTFSKSFGELFDDFYSKLKGLPSAGSYDDGVVPFVI